MWRASCPARRACSSSTSACGRWVRRRWYACRPRFRATLWPSHAPSRRRSGPSCVCCSVATPHHLLDVAIPSTIKWTRCVGTAETTKRWYWNTHRQSSTVGSWSSSGYSRVDCGLTVCTVRSSCKVYTNNWTEKLVQRMCVCCCVGSETKNKMLQLLANGLVCSLRHRKARARAACFSASPSSHRIRSTRCPSLGPIYISIDEAEHRSQGHHLPLQ